MTLLPFVISFFLFLLGGFCVDPIGFFDEYDPDTFIARGWAYQNDTTNDGKEPINVVIILNNTQKLIEIIANTYRPDLVAQNVTDDPYHGFVCNLSEFQNILTNVNARIDAYAVDRDNSHLFILNNSPYFSDSVAFGLRFPRQIQGVLFFLFECIFLLRFF